MYCICTTLDKGKISVHIYFLLSFYVIIVFLFLKEPITNKKKILSAIDFFFLSGKELLLYIAASCMMLSAIFQPYHGDQF